MARAVEIQRELRERLVSTPPREAPRLVAGADASYRDRGGMFFAAVVVFSLRPWRLVEQAAAWGRVSFPYIPGLLSFREAPVLLRAFKKLRSTPDLIIFDSQGIAHPRGIGLAAHMGLLLDTPSIGCAKSRLVGAFRPPGMRAGCRTALMFDGARVGTVLRTRGGVKPVFVSPGHRMDHAGAARWVLRCVRGFRLPEPTRQAHILVNALRRERTAP
ncbi:MAG: deoxyribonuclease V [Chlamydiota bacterium]